MNTYDENQRPTKRENKTEMLATKVTPEGKRIFGNIAKRLGMTGYQLLNLMVSSFIQYTDVEHQLDPDMEQAMNVFDRLVGWEDKTSLVGFEEHEVVRAIYLIAEKESKNRKRGAVAVMVGKPFFGDERRNTTYNVQAIVDEVLRSCCPYLHKRLKQAAAELECGSTFETISQLIELHGPDPDGDTIRELFADARRSEFGRPVDQIKYKQHRNVHQMELFVDTPMKTNHQTNQDNEQA